MDAMDESVLRRTTDDVCDAALSALRTPADSLSHHDVAIRVGRDVDRASRPAIIWLFVPFRIWRPYAQFV